MADVTTPKAGPILSAREREYIRRELDMFFSSLPSVAEEFMIRTWSTGPQAGQPKVPQVAADLIARELLRLDSTERRRPRLFFTEQGLVALRAMMADGGWPTRSSSRISDRNLASISRPTTRARRGDTRDQTPTGCGGR